MSKLINCKNCGSLLIKNTDACPGCGAKVKRTSVLTRIAIIFIGLIVLSAVMAVMSDDPNQDVVTNNIAEIDNNIVETDETQSNEVAEAPIVPNWVYSESVDEMRGTTTYTAITTSRNNVHLDSPYDGGTDLSIVIRNSDELGNELLLVTNNGQLWCEYSNCSMTVKFDEGSIEEYAISRATGGSSDVMFLSNSENDFISKLKASKQTMIEVGFFNNGNKQFTLDTEHLDWQHFQ